jgi:hypothetical protein
VGTGSGGDPLRFSLDPGAPAGSQIDPTTGVFTWTPPDGPLTQVVTVRVTDDLDPGRTATEAVPISVINVPPTPSLGAVPAVARKGTLLTLTATACPSRPGPACWPWSTRDARRRASRR